MGYSLDPGCDVIKVLTMVYCIGSDWLDDADIFFGHICVLKNLTSNLLQD